MGRYIPQREWDAINRMEFTPTDLRLSELERKYLFAAARARDLAEKFLIADDVDCYDIASDWYMTLHARYRAACAIRKAIFESKRAARIARRHGHGGAK